MDTDEVLLERIRAGDQKAFEAIYERYYSQVYDYIYKLVSNREEAEDLAGDTFVVALKKLPRQFRRPGPVGAWLHTVAHSVVARAWRQRCPTCSLDKLPAKTPALVISEFLLGVTSTPNRLRQVQALLARLPTRCRQVLELRFLRLRSTEEAAAEMDIQPDSVERLFRRALATARAVGIAGLEAPLPPEPEPPKPVPRYIQAHDLHARGQSTRQIAAALGITVEYVHKLLSRARQAIRRAPRSSPPEPELASPLPQPSHTGDSTEGSDPSGGIS